MKEGFDFKRRLLPSLLQALVPSDESAIPKGFPAKLASYSCNAPGILIKSPSTWLPKTFWELFTCCWVSSMQEHLLPSAGREEIGNAETHQTLPTQEGKKNFSHEKEQLGLVL